MRKSGPNSHHRPHGRWWIIRWGFGLHRVLRGVEFSEIVSWAVTGTNLPRTLNRTSPRFLRIPPRVWFGGSWCHGRCPPWDTGRGYETRTVSFPYCVSMNRPRLAILRFPRGSGRAVGSVSPRNCRPCDVQLTTATVGMTGIEPVTSLYASRLDTCNGRPIHVSRIGTERSTSELHPLVSFASDKT